MPVMGQEEAPEARAHGHRPQDQGTFSTQVRAGTLPQAPDSEDCPQNPVMTHFLKHLQTFTINKTDILLLKLNI